MGSGYSKESYEERASLKDSRHRLSGNFDPEFDWEMWMTSLQTGNIAGAKTIKNWLLIKYADYPELVKRFRDLPERPFAVQDLGALNPFRDFPYAIDTIEQTSAPAPSYFVNAAK